MASPAAIPGVRDVAWSSSKSNISMLSRQKGGPGEEGGDDPKLANVLSLDGLVICSSLRMRRNTCSPSMGLGSSGATSISSSKSRPTPSGLGGGGVMTPKSDSRLTLSEGGGVKFCCVTVPLRLRQFRTLLMPLFTGLSPSPSAWYSFSSSVLFMLRR